MKIIDERINIIARQISIFKQLVEDNPDNENYSIILDELKEEFVKLNEE